MPQVSEVRRCLVGIGETRQQSILREGFANKGNSGNPDYGEAKRVLNKARSKIPTSPEIWIAAAKLEETQVNTEMVETIVSRAIPNLAANGYTHDREAWLKLAEESEKSQYLATCRAIVKATLTVGAEGMNIKRVWLEDGESLLAEGCVECARALYTGALDKMKTKKSLWLALADLETKHGTPTSLDTVLQQSVKFCPNAEVLWLMAAKQKWLQNDVPKAREILAEAYARNVNTEAISLAAAKLEKENSEYERARGLLATARRDCDSPKVWLQSIQLERQLGNFPEALVLANAALERHSTFPKLWMVFGQLKEAIDGDPQEAVTVYKKGLEACPKCTPLWLCAIGAHRKHKQYSKARVILDMAKQQNPCDELLRLAAIEIEEEAEPGEPHEKQTARYLISRALQECPTSGILWAKAISLEPKEKQTARSVDALKQCENDVHVTLAVAEIFWKNHKIEKARKWFVRALTLDPSVGDAWGAWFAFEVENGDEARQTDLIKKCSQAEPNRGVLWNPIMKRVENWSLKVPQKINVYVKEIFPAQFAKLSTASKCVRDWLASGVKGESVKQESTPSN
eukprot:Polyplicarium_translucidae@DN3299_c0_g1_i1.p1